MRKESWFRGALLCVLIFALVVGGMPLPAAAEGGQSPDGSTTCGSNGNCATNGGTVNAGNNTGGTPGAGNRLGGNPLGGDLTGGMGDPAPVYVPPIVHPPGTIEKGMLKAKIANVCMDLAGAETKVRIAVLIAALAALVLAAGGNIPGFAVLLSAAAVGFAGYDVALSWCNNDFPRW